MTSWKNNKSCFSSTQKDYKVGTTTLPQHRLCGSKTFEIFCAYTHTNWSSCRQQSGIKFPWRINIPFYLGKDRLFKYLADLPFDFVLSCFLRTSWMRDNFLCHVLHTLNIECSSVSTVVQTKCIKKERKNQIKIRN